MSRFSKIGEKLKKRQGTSFVESIDFVTLIALAALVVFGVVMVFSASYYKSINESGSAYGFLKRDIFNIAVGLVLMGFTIKWDYHVYKKFGKAIFFISLLLLGAVLIPGIGTTVNGATRWIRLGPLSIMPGEIAKLALILCVGAELSVRDWKINKPSYWLKFVAVVAIFGALIVKQPNLSTAITVAGIVGGMMIFAGFDLRIVTVILGMGGGGLLALSMTGTYWAKRLTSFIDPFKDAKGDGFQAAQSLLALGTGGLKGLGLGQSIQKNLYLPEPQTDFILAIIGEELGLFRVLILLLVYAFLVWRIFQIAMHAQDKLGMYFASGVGIMIGLQVVLNVAIVTSSMPPTGIALPFVSYGGNAMWIFLACMGIVLNISKTADLPPLIPKSEPRQRKPRERKREGARI